jgi:hypothetical protein
MITNTKQNWQVGEKVRIGFLNLTVYGFKAIKDGLPDIYTLVSLDGEKVYEFIPYRGLKRIN